MHRDQEWKAGPVECAGTTVIGQYDYYDRWNGWLCPGIDAWSVELVLGTIKADVDYWEEYGYEWDWREDGALILIDRQARAEATEEYPFEPEIMEPDEDGLYPLGTYAWTWSEDPSYYDNAEHQEWQAARTTAWVAASNANNDKLANAGINQRFASNQVAADRAAKEWEKTHPEPPDGRDETKVPGEKVIA